MPSPKMPSPKTSSPDRVPFSSIKPIRSDEGMSWDELTKVIGAAPKETRILHDKAEIRARQLGIMERWDEAAQIEKAKGKERKPKKQPPLLKPAVTAAKGPLPAPHVYPERQPTPRPNEYQPTLGLL